MSAEASVVPRIRRSRRAYSGPRLSRILRQVAQASGDRRVSIADLLAVLGDRAFGALMLIFALPNVVPLPLIGLSAVLGLPLVFVSGQMAAGWRTPWLPLWIRQRSLAGSEFRALAGPTVPLIARAERLLMPRWLWLTSPLAERLVGTVCLIPAVILFLPIPFANVLPAAAIAVMALGILQKDGVAVLVGLFLAVVAFVIAAGVVYAMIKTAMFLIYRVLFR